MRDDDRLRLLSDLARYTSQLHRLSFPRMGMLRFEEASAEPTVGAIIERVEESMVDGFGTNNSLEPSTSMVDELLSILDTIEWPSRPAMSIEPVLRMAIETIPKYLDGNGYFTITNTDFDLQNIMVREWNGKFKITGLIDWDNVRTEPSAFGCLRYPAWLNDDWNPVYYAYNEKEDNLHIDIEGESRPADLARYRRHYSKALHEHCKDLPHYDPRMSRLSHILEAIRIALRNEIAQGAIVVKLIKHAFDGNPPFRFPEYCAAFVAGKTEEMDKLIREAFERMWVREVGDLEMDMVQE
jgi:hypothetical protein